MRVLQARRNRKFIASGREPKTVRTMGMATGTVTTATANSA